MTDYTKLTEREINEAVAIEKFGNYQDFYLDKSGSYVCGVRYVGMRFNFAPTRDEYQWTPLLEELRELGNVMMDNESVGLIPKPAAEMKIVKADTLGKAICILWLMVKEVGNNEKL